MWQATGSANQEDDRPEQVSIMLMEGQADKEAAE